MTDQDVRDFLERMATEETIFFPDAEPLTRRARRRAARTVVVGALGVAAAIALLFTGASQLREASPNVPATDPTPTPSPAPGFSTFSSALHGITIDYPAGWTVRPATEPWEDHHTLTFDASDVDVISDPSLGDDVYLALVSEPLGGLSPEDWCCTPQFDVTPPDCGGHGAGSYELDGAEGWAVTSCYSHSLYVATATRGYVIHLHVEPRLGATYDWDWFETALLETVDLRPEDALDGLNLSETP